MDYMFIETLNTRSAVDRIEELCGHYNMDHDEAGYTDFATLVTKVPADFPVDEIEHENWFFGYNIKEDYSEVAF